MNVVFLLYLNKASESSVWTVELGCSPVLAKTSGNIQPLGLPEDAIFRHFVLEQHA